MYPAESGSDAELLGCCCSITVELRGGVARIRHSHLLAWQLLNLMGTFSTY